MRKILFLVMAIMVSGCITAQIKYDKIGMFGANGHPEWAAICNNEKWGFIDMSGKEVVPPKYDKIGMFGANGHPEWMRICDNEKWGFIDMSGKEVVLSKDDISDAMESL
jgi:hypothetical protein